MEMHVEDPGLGLARTASSLGISPACLSTLFKKYGSSSFRDQLIRLRIERAKALLSAGSTPVNEVAAIVGCPDPQYFSTMFRRATGMSPGEYRVTRRSAGDRAS